MTFYHRTWCCSVNFQEKFENISASLNFKFILDFLIFIHWFQDLWNFSCSTIFGIHFLFGLRISSNFLWHFTIRHLYFETLKYFHSGLTWVGLENFWNLFQAQLTWTGLWNFFNWIELIYTYDWICMQLLNYMLLTHTLYCTWLMFLLHKFRLSKLFQIFFIIQ